MKKVTTIIAAFTLFFSATAFTSPGIAVPDPVQESFLKSFSRAVKINWSKFADRYSATFEVNKVITTAVYNEEGNLLGASRIINYADLPSIVSGTINNRFPLHAVTTSVTEMNLEGTTSYLVTIQNDRKILNLKCSPEGTYQIVRRTRK